MIPSLLLAAGPEETALRFKALPPLWLLIMVILPAVILFVWWVYAREGASATARGKKALATLRILAILFVLLILFQPYAETSVKTLLKSHLVVLLDTSASMGFKDTYSDPAKADAVARAADLAGASPSTVSRLDLVKGVLANEQTRLLERLAEQFHVHLYSFSSEAELVLTRAEGLTEEARGELADRVLDLTAEGPVTFLGTAVAGILDEFRLRDEGLAGIVVFTDGRQTGGTVGVVQAARKAAGAQPVVPIYAVSAGDTHRPKNVHVANLRAKEVVLRGDDVAFEFAVDQRGYAGEPVTVTLVSRDPETGREEELDVRGADRRLGEDGEEVSVRVSHKFERAGSYSLRIGIPVRAGEKIEADNFLDHHLRVVDKKIKVLYVEGYPRWEYRYLKNSLIRDTETILAHVINVDADPEGVVQPYSRSPGWKPRQRFPTTKEELFEYDVIIFGDVDWKRLGRSEEEAQRALGYVREFVEEGGGFIMIAGPYEAPNSYLTTDLRHVLPVVVSREETRWSSQDPKRSFNLDLTEEGERHPIMQLDDDPAVSKQIWERDKFSGQFWYFPVERAKTTATVLARHPGEFSHNRNQYGPHVLMASMRYGAGRSLFIGVDELWRLRWSFGDRYYYRFYGEAIRFLATYRLLRGHRRFKIFTDRNTYYVGDRVTVTAQVFDQDFNPSREESQTLMVRTPDGEERALPLELVSDEPGSYVHELTVHQEGTYLLTADVPTGEEERPEKLFKVEYSTEELKNPLVDLETMEALARESGGEALPLFRAAELPDRIPPKSVYVTSEVRSEDLWDDTWVLFVFAALLAAEWLLRKRYRLV